MSELTIIQTLLANSPTAAAVIVAVILFLKRQKEAESEHNEILRTLLTQNTNALNGLNRVVTINCQKLEQMETTVRSCPGRLQNEIDAGKS